jgi:hypothetical protein
MWWQRSAISGLFWRTLLWLIPMLALWYWAREIVVRVPATWADFAMRGLFSWVEGTQLEGTVQSLLTTIPVPHASGREALATPEAHILSYCYGLPLLFALFLGAKAKGLWWKLPVGFFALTPFQAWGICFTWLLTLTHATGDTVAMTTRFTAFDNNVIALGYQLGYLLFPAMVPILLWVYLERRTVATIAVEGALSA